MAIYQTDVVAYNKAEIVNAVRLKWSEEQAVAADDDGLLAAFATSASAVTKDEFLNAMPCPRNITITSGGTPSGNIAAGTIRVHGRNFNGDPITEDFTVTADTALNAVGSKAFASIDKIEFPAMAGTSATFKAGWGAKLGVPIMLKNAPMALVMFDGTPEAMTGTAGTNRYTLVNDADELEKNVFTPNNSLAGKEVDLILFL